MIISVAVDHSEVDALMRATELGSGHIEKFMIELKNDLPPRGFAPYPIGAVEAYRLNDKGSDVFMFYNKDDDYCRGTILTRAGLAKEPEFVATITPYADKQKLEADAEAARESARKASLQRDEERRQEAEHRKALEAAAFTKLYQYLGQNEPPFPTHNERFAAQRLLELEQLQGGTLNLNVLKFDMGNAGYLDSQKINREILRCIYCEKFKHDVEIKFPEEEKMEISFKDLQGNILSKGTFGLYDSENTVVHNDGEYEENITYSTQHIDIEEDVFPPEIIERGRPVLLRDSRFKDAYHVMQEIEIVAPGDIDYAEGTAACRDQTDRMEMFARTIMQTERISHKILNDLTPKVKTLENNTSFGLG